MRPALVLIRNHFYGLRHAARHVQEQPVLKVFVITSFSIGWLLSLTWLFYRGFQFMYNIGGVAFFLIPRLFTLFFMGLGFMLVLSGAITGYANLYQSSEIRRLLAWPVPQRDLYYYKLVKTNLMSSWAFLFIIVPFIGAFAVYRGWHPTMVLWSLAYSIPFVMLWSGTGMLVMLLFQGLLTVLSRILGRHRNRFLWFCAFLLAAHGLLSAIEYLEVMRSQRNEEMMVMVRMIPGLRLASNPLLPNWWMAQGLLGIASGDWTRGLLYLLLLGSSVGMMFLWVARVGTWMFPGSMQRHLTAANDLATRASRLSALVQSVLPGGGALRAYFAKDLLLFLRDPSQWTQFLIFFALLGLYFFNLGSLGYDQLDSTWINLISFLNLFSLSAVMSSLSSRFSYPQMSMEGRTLWLVGLAPQSLSRLMMIKFLNSFLGLLLISITLSTLSNTMLQAPRFGQMITLVLMPSISMGLAGMSTGLGAMFMDIHAKSSSQVLSGYGGTLNLILTLLIVILLVLPPGMVAHYLTTNELLDSPRALRMFWLSAAYILVLSTLASGLPLWLGHRTLLSRDF